MSNSPIDRQRLMQTVSSDQTIEDSVRTSLISSLKDDRFFQGLVGSVTGYAVAKFLKLSKRSQILLTLGGFGIARALIKHQEQQAHGDKTHTYDKKTHTYEVKY